MLKFIMGAWLALNSQTGLPISQQTTVSLHCVEGKVAIFIVCHNDLCLPIKVSEDGKVQTPRTPRSKK